MSVGVCVHESFRIAVVKLSSKNMSGARFGDSASFDSS
jgi:hypothetical protein